MFEAQYENFANISFPNIKILELRICWRNKIPSYRVVTLVKKLLTVEIRPLPCRHTPSEPDGCGSAVPTHELSWGF